MEFTALENDKLKKKKLKNQTRITVSLPHVTND